MNKNLYDIKRMIRDLEIYRLENKITQEKLADILGVAFCTVNRWFNFRNCPNKIQFYHIKKLLKKEVKKNYERKKRN